MVVFAEADPDTSDDTDTITSEGKAIHSLAISVTDDDKDDAYAVKSQALAIPSSDSGDNATLRVHCKQNTPCSSVFDCSAQSDGSVFEGRLGCSLRSQENISAQLWTLSGNGILVNNSAMVRSTPEGRAFRADIESIPSPDLSDESNIRIRYNSDARHCYNISLACY